MKPRPLLRLGDRLLLLLVGIVAVACICLLFLLRHSGTFVTVTVNGNFYGRYSLQQNQEIPIGETNLLTIADGKATMTWADCTNQICVHHAAISAVGQSIICLPNQVIVLVEGEAATDAVTE